MIQLLDLSSWFCAIIQTLPAECAHPHKLIVEMKAWKHFSDLLTVSNRPPQSCGPFPFSLYISNYNFSHFADDATLTGLICGVVEFTYRWSQHLKTFKALRRKPHPPTPITLLEGSFTSCTTSSPRTSIRQTPANNSFCQKGYLLQLAIPPRPICPMTLRRAE